MMHSLCQSLLYSSDNHLAKAVTIHTNKQTNKTNKQTKHTKQTKQTNKHTNKQKCFDNIHKLQANYKNKFLLKKIMVLRGEIVVNNFLMQWVQFFFCVLSASHNLFQNFWQLMTKILRDHIKQHLTVIREELPLHKLKTKQYHNLFQSS